MARKQITVSRHMLFTWLMLAGFILLFTPQRLTSKLQFAFARVFSWPLGFSRNISIYADAQQSLTDVIRRGEYDRLSGEYNRLQNHLDNLARQLQQERQKVDKLSGLRNRVVFEGAKLILADIIRAPVEGFTINRGEKDGLVKGQFVLGDDSIIGVVSNVSSRMAGVKLITDSAYTMPVEVAGLNAMMQGDGKNLAKIKMLSKKHKIKAGDVVYARKTVGFLDAPMIVGRVSQCKTSDDDPLLWDVTVKPACEIENLSDVAVIIMN